MSEIMKNTQSFLDLLQDATSLLLDHPKEIQDLIYWAVTLDAEERSALSMAYRNIHKEEDER